MGVGTMPSATFAREEPPLMPEAPVPESPMVEIPASDTAADQPVANPRRVGLVLILSVLVLLEAAAFTVTTRLGAEEKLREVTAAVAVPSVRIILPRTAESRPL